MLTVDTETTGLAYTEGTPSVFMVQWADADGEHVCDWDTGFEPFLAAIQEHDVLILANASFDAHHLRASGIVDLMSGQWRVHDVLTLARVAIPGRFGYRLEQLGTDLLGADATEAQRELKDAAKRHGVSWTKEDKDYVGLWRAEPELMERYGKEDVRLTYDLWEHIWSRALPRDIEVYRTEIAGVAPILRAAERDGVLVDQAALAVLRERLQYERDALHEKLLGHGISEAALGQEATEDEAKVAASSKALLADLLEAGVPLYRMTPKGKSLAVDKDSLKEFARSHPVIGDLLAWRSRNQTLRTYVGALERADPRVHTSFNQVQARTSRMSASRPNMQNLPKTAGIRDVLIPAPGNAFIVGDYDSIEVRMLAHMIADEGLIAQLEAGMDLYSLTAGRVNGLAYEDCLKGGLNDALRDKAKTTTLTAMYGGGARLLSTRLGCTVEEAAKIKHDTLDSIPGYWRFEARVKAAVRGRMFPHVVSILGRRLYVPRNKPYVALNTIIQGNSAEIMKLGMIAAAPVIAEFGYGVRLVVHDELVAEGPASCAEQALSAMISAMESVYPLRPSLKVSGGFSTESYGASK